MFAGSGRRPGLRKRGRYTSMKDESEACRALEISPEQASSDIDREFIDRSNHSTFTEIQFTLDLWYLPC